MTKRLLTRQAKGPHNVRRKRAGRRKSTGQILAWWWCYMNVRGFPKLVTSHPECDIDIFTKCHGNLSHSCWDISLKAKSGGAQRKRGSLKSRLILWGPVVDWHCHPWGRAASVAKNTILSNSCFLIVFSFCLSLLRQLVHSSSICSFGAVA